MYRFLDLSILQSKVYPEVVKRLKGGEKLLDLGCCFGQEIRQLVIMVQVKNEFLNANFLYDRFQMAFRQKIFTGRI